MISDIHGNLEALKAVLADAEDVTAWWCLGDVVGYGPHPRECLALVRQRCCLIIAGNHDRGVSGEVPETQFNPTARHAILWTRTQLPDADLLYLARLPLREEPEPFTLVHGSPRAPLEEYILSAEQAVAAMDMIDTKHLLVGHSHLQFIWASEVGFEPAEIDETGRAPWLSLCAGPLLLNPGSVGQPRDGDNRAAYAVIDLDRSQFQLRRVAYPIEQTQSAMRDVGLPAVLADRLAHGV